MVNSAVWDPGILRERAGSEPDRARLKFMIQLERDRRPVAASRAPSLEDDRKALAERDPARWEGFLALEKAFRDALDPSEREQARAKAHAYARAAGEAAMQDAARARGRVEALEDLLLRIDALATTPYAATATTEEIEHRERVSAARRKAAMARWHPPENHLAKKQEAATLPVVATAPTPQPARDARDALAFSVPHTEPERVGAAAMQAGVDLQKAKWNLAKDPGDEVLQGCVAQAELRLERAAKRVLSFNPDEGVGVPD